MELAFGPPLPAAPWQDEQNVAYTCEPREGSPGVVDEYDGRFAPAKAFGCDQRSRIPWTIRSICFSVSIPPALCAKAGMDVPEIPLLAARRRIVSSAIARYTGSPSAIAAPARPSAPWHPAQFSPYRTLKSEISLGTMGVLAASGFPGALAHPHIIADKTNAAETRRL